MHKENDFVRDVERRNLFVAKVRCNTADDVEPAVWKAEPFTASKASEQRGAQDNAHIHGLLAGPTKTNKNTTTDNDNVDDVNFDFGRKTTHKGKQT